MIIRTRKIEHRVRGERIQASGAGRTRLVPLDDLLDTEQMHIYAARMLAREIVESYAAPEVHVLEIQDDGYVFTTEVNG